MARRYAYLLCVFIIKTAHFIIFLRMSSVVDVITGAIGKNNVDGEKMSKLAEDTEGPRKMAEMCEGYAEMDALEQMKMVVTCAVVLESWKKDMPSTSDSDDDPVIPDEQELAEPEPKRSKRAGASDGEE